MTVTIGQDRRLNLYNDKGNVRLVADLAGYYGTGGGAGHTALTPRRVLDTRPESPVGAGATRVLDLTDRIPASATAVTFTLTGVNPTASTFVTAWPTGASRPTAWNLNLFANETRSNPIWAWGNGLLGNGSVEPSPVPVQVTGLTGITAIAAGSFTAYACAATVPFGRGVTTAKASSAPVRRVLRRVRRPASRTKSGTAASPVPVQVSGVTSIAGGDRTAYAARGDGTVVAWGSSLFGALGNGTECEPETPPCESRVPAPVPALTDVTRLSGFGFGAYVIRADGSVWAWGDNRDQQLADDSVFRYSTVPVPVGALPAISDIVGGADAGYALVPQR